MFKRKKGLLLLLIVAGRSAVAPVASASVVDFETPTYTQAAIAGQDGWAGPGSVVDSSETRFGAVAGGQSTLVDASMSRSVAGDIASSTPFSFLWDWSPVFPGNSRFIEYDIAVSGVRIIRFGAQTTNGGSNTEYYTYGLVNNTQTFFSAVNPTLRPVTMVSGVLDFATLTYDLTFTDVTTNVAYPFSAKTMVTAPTLVEAQATAEFMTTGNVEGNHYIDNVTFGPAVPEASSLLLCGVGACGVMGLRSIRRRK